MQKPRALVTGGSGFIGTHLVQKLLDEGFEVSNLDLKPPVLIDHRPHWSRINLLDAAALEHTFLAFRPEIVFNLAADADIKHGGDALRVNTSGLGSVISASRAARSRRLIQVSTQLVVRPGYRPTNMYDLAPYTEYGETKAASERLMWEVDDLDWIILRPTTVWGPGHGFFTDSIWKYINRRWYLLPSGKDPIRCFGYVANVVGQMISAARAVPAVVTGKVFYVGDVPVRSSRWLDGFSHALTGQPVRRVPAPLLRLFALAGEVSGRIGGPSPIDLGRYYRMTTDYEVPMAQSFAALGRGEVTMDQGIEETCAWLRGRYPEEYRGR